MTTSKKEKIQMEVGQMVDISLESMMGSTGYSWELSKLDGAISLYGISIVPGSTESISPVTQKFHIRGMKIGSGEVEFVLTAPWKTEAPVKTAAYQIDVTKAKEVSEDDLKLKGFVGNQQADVRNGMTEPKSLYAVYPPTPDYGVLTADLWQRLYYGIFPPINIPTQQYADPRLYYGVCCAPDPRTANVASDPRLYYGVCCAPGASATANYQVPDPRVYYGVCCAPTDDLCSIPPQVFKYGVLPIQPYGVLPVYGTPPMAKYNFPPVAKYNIPPVMRYNYPSENADCC